MPSICLVYGLGVALGGSSVQGQATWGRFFRPSALPLRVTAVPAPKTQNLMIRVESPGVRFLQAADEEDRSAARVADQEEERVIGAEDNGLFGHAHSGGVHGDAGGGGGFGSLL